MSKTPEIKSTAPVDIFTIASGETATEGHLACLNASAECLNAEDATGLTVAGRFEAVRSTAETAEIKDGVFRFENSATHAFAREDRGAVAYVEDSETVSSDSGTYAVIAGLVVDVDDDGVFVDTRAPARAAAQALHDVGSASESAMVTPTTSALTLTAMTGTANTAPAAETNTTNLTDSGGGTADGTVAAQAAPVTLTDSSGLDGTHSDTIAATAAIVTVTDSSGLHGSHDDTIAAVTNTTNLTDNGGGTADGTVAAQAAPVTLTDSTGLDGTHDDTIAASALAAGTLGGAADGTMETVGATNGGDVSGAIMNNFQDILAAVTLIRQNESDLAQKVIELVTLAGVAQNNLKEVTTELATQRTANGVLAQNQSDLAQKAIELVARTGVTDQNVSSLAQKVIELVTLAGVAQNNLKEVTTELATQRAANGVLAQNQSNMTQKIIELVTLAGVAQNNLKEVTTELATQRALNTVLVNDAKTFATQLNAAKTDLAAVITVLKAQNIMASA